MMKKSFIAVLLSVVFITSCSTNSVIDVVNADLLDGEFAVASVTVNNSTGQAFDIDIESMLTKGLLDELGSQSILDETGGKFNLDVSIVQYEKGNAFARWMERRECIAAVAVEIMISRHRRRSTSTFRAPHHANLSPGQRARGRDARLSTAPIDAATTARALDFKL